MEQDIQALALNAPLESTEKYKSYQRLYAEAQVNVQQDLSFLSFLEEPMVLQAEKPVSTPGKDDDAKAAEQAEAEKKAELLRQLKDKKSAEQMQADKQKATTTETGMDKSATEFDQAMAMWAVDLKQLPPQDWMFLHQLAKGQSPVQPIQNFSPSLLQQMPQLHYKSLGVSGELQMMMEKAYKTQRPIRIDLTDTATVILKLGRDGRVSAEFMPSDQAAELFFRQNMAELKSRLEAKHLPYGELTVRQWKQNQQEKERRQQQQQS